MSGFIFMASKDSDPSLLHIGATDRLPATQIQEMNTGLAGSRWKLRSYWQVTDLRFAVDLIDRRLAGFRTGRAGERLFIGDAKRQSEIISELLEQSGTLRLSDIGNAGDTESSLKNLVTDGKRSWFRRSKKEKRPESLASADSQTMQLNENHDPKPAKRPKSGRPVRPPEPGRARPPQGSDKELSERFRRAWNESVRSAQQQLGKDPAKGSVPMRRPPRRASENSSDAGSESSASKIIRGIIGTIFIVTGFSNMVGSVRGMAYFGFRGEALGAFIISLIFAVSGLMIIRAGQDGEDSGRD